MPKDSYKFTVDQMVAAIKANKGMVYNAAKALDCHVQTVYNYRDKYPAVRKALDAEKNSFVSLAYLRLFEAVDRGDSWAVPFVLKTLGKDQGFTERQEVTGNNGDPVSITISYENSNEPK